MEEKKERIRADPYIKIPVDLLGLGLSPGAVLAFGLLCDRAKNSADLSCIYSDSDLAVKLGESLKTAKRQIAELRGCGLIERARTATITGKSKTKITAFDDLTRPNLTEEKDQSTTAFTRVKNDPTKDLLGSDMTPLNEFTRVKNDPLLGSDMTPLFPYIYRNNNQKGPAFSGDGQIDNGLVQNGKPNAQPKTTEKPKKQKTTTITREQALNGLADLYKSPEVVDAWAAFLDMRKQQKKPVSTMRALNGLIKKLGKLAQTDEQRIAVIDQSTMNGWAGFYPLKDEKKPSGGGLGGGWGDIDI